MNVKQRPYRTVSDVDALRNFNAAAIRDTGGCGYLHPGDISHHFFGGNNRYNPAELTTIWEDDRGVVAWALIGPRHRSFDLQVRPDFRTGEFERSALEIAENRLRELMSRYGVEGDKIAVMASSCDTTRSQLLLESGWTEGTKSEYVLNRRSLTEIPESLLPVGYRIRAVCGLEEAGMVADLHAAVFTGSGWTAELYRRFMQAPGYSSDRELLVEAPDGTPVAFAVMWYDRANQCGHFEPVGTHADHRRKGVGRAPLYAAMHQMASDEIRYATVQNAESNKASEGLYRSCGFEPWQYENSYFKMVE